MTKLFPRPAPTEIDMPMMRSLPARRQARPRPDHWWSLARVAVLLGAPAALAQDDSVASVTTPEATLPAISVSEVVSAPLRERVIASGLVGAVEEVQVQPLVQGQQIDALLADVGDRVEAGQVLARLSGLGLELELSQLRANEASARAGLAQAEAALSEARGNAAEAERQAARNAGLAERGTVPQATADQTRAAAEATRASVRVAEQAIASAQAQTGFVAAQVASAELQLARIEVKAPVAGLVVARNAQVDAISTAAGEAMITIVRDAAMELRAEVSEQDLLRLRASQPVHLDATNAAEPLTGTVRLVEPSIDPGTRLGRVRIALDDPSPVVAGMFPTAEILASEGEALAVPVTAGSAGADGSFVTRVRPGTVERVPVTTGIRDGLWIGGTRGMAAGDLVVTQAAAFPRDGDAIDPVRDRAGKAFAQLQGE